MENPEVFFQRTIRSEVEEFVAKKGETRFSTYVKTHMFIRFVLITHGIDMSDQSLLPHVVACLHNFYVQTGTYTFPTDYPFMNAFLQQHFSVSTPSEVLDEFIPLQC